MDMAQVIDDAAERKLDETLFALEASNGTQVAVVAVPEIDGRTPKAFATALFNRWGVGQKGVNNGVLVLLVMDQRRIEIEVGDGANRFLTNSKCDQILQSRAVPYFKKGNYSDGMSNVVTAICTELGSVKYQAAARPKESVAEPAALKKLPSWEQGLLRPLLAQDSFVSDSAGVLDGGRREALNKVSRVLLLDNGTVLAVLTVKGEGRVWDKPEFVFNHWKSVEPQAERGVFVLFNGKKSEFFIGVGKEVKPFISWERLKPYKRQATELLSQNKYGEALSVLNGAISADLKTVDYRLKKRVPLERVRSVRKAEDARREAYARTGGSRPQRHGSGDVSWWAFGSLGGGLLAGILAIRSYFRNKPRVCRCGQVMDRLAESAEDEYLNSGQQAEENVASVDYDVWLCSACGNRTIERYSSWFSGMKSCPACSYRTLRVSRETVESPTTYSEGRGRQEETCNHCRHHNVSYYSIARLPEPTSSDSSSSYSSSSSDSSWGGGSSHGGGSGASW